MTDPRAQQPATVSDQASPKPSGPAPALTQSLDPAVEACVEAELAAGIDVTIQGGSDPCDPTVKPDKGLPFE